MSFSVEIFHKMETLANHLVELPLPFLSLIPDRRIQLFAGVVQVLFQVNCYTLSVLVCCYCPV
jgi:hypothetical protein